MNKKYRKKRGSTRYLVLFIFITALFSGLWYTLTLFLKDMEYFNIEKIEIVGQKNLDPAFLQNVSKDYIGMNIFKVKKQDVIRKYESIVRVKKAKVSRRYPSTLKVEIQERTGMLYVKTSDGDFFPIDSEFIVLDKADFYFSEDIPLVSLNMQKSKIHLGEKLNDHNLKLIMALHQTIMKIDKSFVNSISEYYIKEKSIVFVDSHSGCRVILGNKDIEKRIERYVFLRSNKGFKKNTVVDLRYNDQIIVRD
ncbi:MAG TPA: FtsQ-type POTRA domain-containing protein [Candidatus Cloacimonadota bacterium]|nr:FtsQ-type POTRA domain-containing protein [Candidatus Cloacimonadota bacterium]HPM02877.1 FtsQ-type POTRA domain-containing protein [Candidatus Cloacimonadota bacterium]